MVSNDALRNIQEMEGFEEIRELREVLQGLSEEVVDLPKEINKALEGIQDMEKVITDYSR